MRTDPSLHNCEEQSDEAILSFAVWPNGLLRFARNDEYRSPDKAQRNPGISGCGPGFRFASSGLRYLPTHCEERPGM